MTTRPLIPILILAALLRFALLAAAYPAEERVLRGDSPGNIQLARTLKSHHRFAFHPEEPPDTFRTPGYPTFLALAFALCGDRVWPALALQIALSLVTIALAWRLAVELELPASAALVAGVAALDPPSTTHAVLILSETVFSCLIAGALVALVRAVRTASPGSAMAAGAALGLAVIVRPIGLYLGPFGALFVVLAARAPLARRLALAALMLGLALAPPLAWMARNDGLGAGFMLSSIEGMNLLYYRAAPVLARATGQTWPQAMAQLDGDLTRRTGRQLVWDAPTCREAKSLALDVLRAHPKETVAVGLDGVMRFWGGAGNADLMLLIGATEPGHEARWPEQGTPAHRALGWALSLGATGWHLAVLVAALIGVVAWCRERRFAALAFAIGTLGLFTVLSAGPGAYARFRVPVTPVVAVLAAVGVSRIRSRSRPAPSPAEPAAPPVPAAPVAAATPPAPDAP